MKHTILVIDDDEGVLKYISLLLTHEEYSVFVASDINSALKILQNETPDLIIFDLGLARGQGINKYHTMKNDDKCKDIPIVIVTGMGDKECELISKTMGAKGFISKPFDNTDFVNKIKSLIVKNND